MCSRSQGAALLLGFVLALACAGRAGADLTAANSQRDRGPFVKCSNAMDVLHTSSTGREDASIACAAALKFYSEKTDAAKTEDDQCYYGLYAGSAAERMGYILSSSLNQSGSKKMYSLGDRVLEAVLKSCPDEPNILKMAKGVLKGSRALRSKVIERGRERYRDLWRVRPLLLRIAALARRAAPRS